MPGFRNGLTTFAAGLLISTASVARGSAPDSVAADSAGLASLKSALAVLEDSTKRSELAGQLRSLIEATERVAAKESTARERPLLSINVFDRLAMSGRRISASVKDLVAELRTFAGGYEYFRSEMSRQEYRERLVSFLLLLAMSLGLGVAAGLLTWRLAQSIVVPTAPTRPDMGSRMLRAARSALRRLSFWIGLTVGGLVFAFLPALPPDPAMFLKRIIPALLAYATARTVVIVLALPRDEAWTVLPLERPQASWLVLWTGHVLRFSIVMYVLHSLAQLFDWPAVSALIAGAYKAGLAVLLAIAVYHVRKGIPVPRILRPDSGSPAWRRNLSRAVLYGLGRLHVVVILYLAAVVVISLLGFSNVYSFMLVATLKTAALVAGVAMLWILWGKISARLRSAGGAAFVNRPELGGPMRRNLRIVEKAGFAVVIFCGALLLLAIWGADVYGLLRSNKPLLRALLNISIIVAIAMLLIQLAHLLVLKVQKEAAVRMRTANKISPIEIEKRVSTLGGILDKIVLSAIVVITAMMILDELGLDIKAMLAGVGIIGLAVGFGAQNLVRDVISGLFLIFENRIRIGDVAVINGTGGVVEQVNLRTTVLRSLDGTVHVFPNGAISSLSNMTHEYSYYVFDIAVAYKEDTDRVAAVVKELGDQLMNEAEFADAIVEPLEILGVDSLGDSAVVIKARFKTQPIRQWKVGREMNRRIKKRFDELGIEIPFPHRSFYFGEASKPIRVTLDSGPSAAERPAE